MGGGVKLPVMIGITAAVLVVLALAGSASLGLRLECGRFHHFA